jgi:biopolymer transport protein ExbD
MKKRKHEVPKDGEIGFQIAPMIDVVFVIMLFFMVLAGDRQVETLMPMTLPSEEADTRSDVTPMEEQIFVDMDGEVTHNEAPVTANELKLNFGLLAKQAEAEGGGTNPTPIVVTIGADPETPWEKVTTVLNAMTAAKINNVTFSVGDE